jgi:hypothetical protein
VGALLLLPRIFHVVHDLLDDLLLTMLCFGLGFLMMDKEKRFSKNALFAFTLLLFHADAVTCILDKLHATQWSSSPFDWAIFVFCRESMRDKDCFGPVLVNFVMLLLLNFPPSLDWVRSLFVQLLPRLGNKVSSCLHWFLSDLMVFILFHRTLLSLFFFKIFSHE